MKKLVSLLLAAVMLLSVLSLSAFAADEQEIPIDVDHLGSGAATAEEVSFSTNSVTANGISLFAMALPQSVPIGDTVVIHIKGTSDGDFRVWLLAAGESPDKGTQATFSNQWKASENGFAAPGEFEKFIELTAEDFDAVGGTEGDRVAFKAASWDTTLENLTITYLGIIYGSLDDLDQAAANDAVQYLDASNNALAAAQAAGTDETALNAALADANAAVDSLTEAAATGMPTVTEYLNTAKGNVRAIEDLITAANEQAAVDAVQSYADTVNTALDTAKAASGTPEEKIATITAALNDAQTAADYVANNTGDVRAVETLAKELSNTVSEIQSLLDDANAEKAAADQAAADAAARTRTIIIVVIAVVVVVVVVVIIVAVVLKKKKK